MESFGFVTGSGRLPYRAPGSSSLSLTGTRKRFPRIRVTIPWRSTRLSTCYNEAMSRKVRRVEEDLIEAIREDDLASIIAQLRERAEAEDVHERIPRIGRARAQAIQLEDMPDLVGECLTDEMSRRSAAADYGLSYYRLPFAVVNAPSIA